MSPRRSRAWRRGGHRGGYLRRRPAQFTLAALAAAVAVVVAVVVIAQVDDHVGAVNAAAFSGCAGASAASASASAAAAPAAAADTPSGAPAASPSASAAPCPSASPTGARVNVTADDFAGGALAARQLGDVASAPVDGQGDPINLNQSADQAAASGNCTIAVPPNPLTARGLATPYRLGDGCSEANAAEQAFVEATILSPSGRIQVYDPLVVTQGTRPAARPVTPRIARGSRVIIDFGFNGTNLVLTGRGARQRSSGCVDALGQSVIGQVSACDAVPFYNLANAEIARGTLKVPALGTSADGQACLSSRAFALIDQDQSDNTYSQYLLTGSGQTAQATKATTSRISGASTITNGSDNALLGDFVDPANGCQPFTAPDPTNRAGTQSSQALDELSARAGQQPHIAVTPTNDEMVLVGGAFSVAKTNMYRSLVDQPQLAAGTNPYQVAAAYCMNLVNVAPARDQLDATSDAGTTSPVPAVGNNLATFLGNRLSMSFANLGCGGFGLTDPVGVTADGNGVATAVSYVTAQQQASLPVAQATVKGGGRHRAPSQGHGRHHKVQDPSGM